MELCDINVILLAWTRFRDALGLTGLATVASRFTRLRCIAIVESIGSRYNTSRKRLDCYRGRSYGDGYGEEIAGLIKLIELNYQP